MTGEQWERIKQIFASALERDPSSRAAFLDGACAGDAELRREVDSLLAAHQASDTFLENPATGISSPAPAHTAFGDGETVGTYRIVRTLGRGGMATVYLARDLGTTGGSAQGSASRAGPLGGAGALRSRDRDRGEPQPPPHPAAA